MPNQDKPDILLADGTNVWLDEKTDAHRDGDKPAVIHPDGSKQWYIHGDLHRDGDMPAIIHSNGDKNWYKNGQLHRDGDKPAIEDSNGHRAWYKDGKMIDYTTFHKDNSINIRNMSDYPTSVLDGNVYWKNASGNYHRDGDMPAIVKADGSKYWYQDGKLHRDGDKPTIIHADGTKNWHKNGVFGRDDDLHVVEYSNGGKFWYKDGKFYQKRHKPPKPLCEFNDITNIANILDDIMEELSITTFESKFSDNGETGRMTFITESTDTFDPKKLIPIAENIDMRANIRVKTTDVSYSLSVTRALLIEAGHDQE